MRRMQAAFPGNWTAVSALTEGADRLVVRRLLARAGTRLLAVLPLPRADYETDFAEAASEDEFVGLLRRADEVVEVGPQGNRDDAYQAADLAVQDRSDVLIAVWDGPGGAGPRRDGRHHGRGPTPWPAGRLDPRRQPEAGDAGAHQLGC